MTWWQIALIAAGAALLLIIPCVIVWRFTWKIAAGVFEDKLVRTSPDKWDRTERSPEVPVYHAMFERGQTWGEAHKETARPVCIEHDGLTLAAEVYDFGAPRWIVIVHGRAESLVYDYYYAELFEKIGCNLLLPDMRAHGESEGVYDTAGGAESGDLLAWVRYLRDEKGAERVCLYGISTGASAVCLAAASPDLPDVVKGALMDSPYRSFYESTKCRMRNDGRPTFPVAWQILLCGRRAGFDLKKSAPGRHVASVRVPLMLLCSKGDVTVEPAHGQWLYEHSGAPVTRLYWSETASHSFLRHTDGEAYDRAVSEFVADVDHQE